VSRLSSADSRATTDAATTEEVPADEAEEVDEAREALVADLRSELGDALVDTHIDPGREVWARVSLEAWVAAGTYARDGLACPFFDFLSAIDWMPSPFGRDMNSQEDLIVHGAPDGAGQAPGAAAVDELVTGYAGGDARFQLLARVQAPSKGHGLVLKADLGDDPDLLRAATWVPVYAGAAWHEREAWEMFGISFEGHPNLIHLYLPGEFEGHPLRKDFPLLSRRVKPWPGIVDVEPMPGEDEVAPDEAAQAGAE
jgi:NADH-quinone oxidoreductase subunit C